MPSYQQHFRFSLPSFIFPGAHILHCSSSQVFLTPRYLAIVMEFANLGDLHTYVMARKGLGEIEARWFFQQLILAVDYCHRMVSVWRGVGSKVAYVILRMHAIFSSGGGSHVAVRQSRLHVHQCTP